MKNRENWSVSETRALVCPSRTPHVKKRPPALRLVRGGGTGPASPVLAGPLFSDQVINIHKLSLRTAAAQPKQAAATVSSGHSQACKSCTVAA